MKRNTYDADHGRVKLDVAETAELGGSAYDLLGVGEVKLLRYVRKIHFRFGGFWEKEGSEREREDGLAIAIAIYALEKRRELKLEVFALQKVAG